MKSFNISPMIYLVSLSPVQYKSINTELRIPPYVRALKNNAKYLCLSVKGKTINKTALHSLPWQLSIN